MKKHFFCEACKHAIDPESADFEIGALDLASVEVKFACTCGAKYYTFVDMDTFVSDKDGEALAAKFTKGGAK